MIGDLAAVETWVMRDQEEVWERWLSYLDTIAKRVETINGSSTSVHEPEGLNNKSPRLDIMWDQQRFNVTGAQVAEILGRTKPRIAVGSRDQDGTASINVTAGQMQPGEDDIVANRRSEERRVGKECRERSARTN